MLKHIIKNTISLTAIVVAGNVYCASPTTINASDPLNLDATILDMTTSGKNLDRISFNQGSANLTDAEKISLKAIVSGTSPMDDQATHKLKKVIIAAWPDINVPVARDGKSKDYNLPRREKDLAEKRRDNVKQALIDMGIDKSKIEAYSMADKPSWIARVFNTDEAKIKSPASAVGAGETTTHDDTIASIAYKLNSSGGPSSAVAIVVRDKPAHEPKM